MKTKRKQKTSRSSEKISKLKSSINYSSDISSEKSTAVENIIRIDEDFGNAEIITDENSVNTIIVTNADSRSLNIICAKNSVTKYIEINNSKKEKSETKIIRDISLRENSVLNFYNIYAGKGTQLSSTKAELSENSGIYVRNIFLAEKQNHNHDVIVIHKGENSKSDLQSRGLLSDSKIVLKGLIKIEQNAGESEGYQKSDILILNDSEAVSIPDLEIHNNNVKCSHGSSITQMDDYKIFYLQTRGLDEISAKNILASAFISSLIKDLQENERSEIDKIIEDKLLSIVK